MQNEPVGNAAAMREALENSNGLLEELAAIGEWGESAREQIAENNAALAVLPRNCDRFNSVKDAALAFARAKHDIPHPCPDFTFSTWLFATSTETEGEFE